MFDPTNAADRRKALGEYARATQLWAAHFQKDLEAIVAAKYGGTCYYPRDVELHVDEDGDGWLDCEVWEQGLRNDPDRPKHHLSLPLSVLLRCDQKEVVAEIRREQEMERQNLERKRMQDEQAREMAQLRRLQEKYGRDAC